MDEGTAAGTVRAVRLFASTLVAKLAERGLTTNEAKCEVISAAGPSCEVRQTDFPNMKLVLDGNFKLLGSAIGDSQHVAKLLEKRCTKARVLVDATAGMSNVQGGLVLP